MIFSDIYIEGWRSPLKSGIGFFIAFAFMLECIIAIPLILSLVVVYFRTEKGGFVEKIKFTSKWEYLFANRYS